MSTGSPLERRLGVRGLGDPRASRHRSMALKPPSPPTSGRASQGWAAASPPLQPGAPVPRWPAADMWPLRPSVGVSVPQTPARALGRGVASAWGSRGWAWVWLCSGRGAAGGSLVSRSGPGVCTERGLSRDRGQRHSFWDSTICWPPRARHPRGCPDRPGREAAGRRILQ